MSDITAKLQISVEILKKEIGAFHIGRATPALVEDLLVEYYGTKTPVKQLATITAPEAKVLVIQPFDANASKDIEKAIRQSSLGVSPTNEGKIIRIVFPPLTDERRQQLVKILREKLEEAKIRIRKNREEELRSLKRAEKDGEMSEDEMHAEEKEIQKAVDEKIKDIESLAEEKESEIRHV